MRTPVVTDVVGDHDLKSKESTASDVGAPHDLVRLLRTRTQHRGTRTRPQISTCPFQFCDESIKKLEITKETSTVIVGFDETRFQPKEISSE
jgi:hypothetical protein